MPDPLSLLRRLGLNLPDPAQSAPLADGEVMPELPPEQQSPLPKWAQKASDVGLNAVVGGFKGLTGLGDQGEAGPSFTNAGQLLGAALPFLPGSKAVGGLKGLYSRVSKAAEDLPAMVHPTAALKAIKNNASGEEMSLRKVGEFLGAQDPNRKIAREAIIKHLEDNPLPELTTKTFGESLYNVHAINEPYHSTPRAMNITEQEARDYINTHMGGNGAIQRGHVEDPTRHGLGSYERGGVPGSYRERITMLPSKPQAPPGPRSGVLDEFFDEIDAKEAGNYRSPHWPGEGPVMSHSAWDERHLQHPTGKWGVEDFTAGQNMGEDPLWNTNQWSFGKIGQPSGDNYSGWGDTEEIAREDLLRAVNHPDNAYVPPVGPKGRMVQEVQSDWHQTGRREGYQGQPETPVDESMIRPGYGLKYRGGEDGPMWRVEAPDGSTALNGLNDAWHSSREDALRSHLGLGDRANQPPDAPFKDSWSDLELKQHVRDVMEDPSLNWLGITSPETQIKRGGESTRKGMEEWYGRQYPSKLDKIMKLFGGGVEQGELPGPTLKWDTHHVTPVDWGPDNGLAAYSGNVRRGGEHIASTYPPVVSQPGAVITARENAADLADIMRKQPGMGDPGIPFSMSRVTPEMRAIYQKLKAGGKGIPFLSLAGLQAAQPDMNQGDER